eukprot:5923414-Lingulodinium_polyedra.AAC.1
MRTSTAAKDPCMDVNLDCSEGWGRSGRQVARIAMKHPDWSCCSSIGVAAHQCQLRYGLRDVHEGL